MTLQERYALDDSPDASDIGRPTMAAKAPVIDVKPLNKSDLQPSYSYRAADADTHNNGAYGSFMNGLGSCIGTIGAIPCCPCPNPYSPSSSYSPKQHTNECRGSPTGLGWPHLQVRALLYVLWPSIR